MRHLSVIVIPLMFMGAATASGQGRDDGSLYSRYGIGQLASFASSQAQALGGSSVGLISYNYLNFGNPASWSRQSFVRVAVGVQFDRLQAQDAIGRSEEFIRGGFNAIQIGFPFYAGRLGMGIAYEPYSRVHYRVSATATLQTSESEELPYQVNHEGSGGLYQARIGIGYKVTSWASVGASADMVFGIIEEGRRTIFDSVDLLQTNLVSNTRLFGIAPTAGLTLSLDGQDYEFVAAVSGSLPITLDGTRTLTLGESLNTDTLETISNGNLKLPARIQGGVSFSYQNRWLISTEIRHEPWSKATTSLPLMTYNSNHLRDRMRYSIGVELVPAGSSLQSSYLSRTAYRVGFYRDQLYASPVAGRDVVVIAVTGGLGLPTLFFGTRIDLSFEVGTRGSTDHNLIKDRFIGVSATLNIGERWFVKRKLG